jgi:hypothetical protein
MITNPSKQQHQQPASSINKQPKMIKIQANSNTNSQLTASKINTK